MQAAGTGSERSGRGPLSPFLAAPAMRLLHLADHARLDDRDHGPVDLVRMDLDAHLRDQFLFGRDPGQLPGLVDGLRQRLLRIDVQPLLHGPHGDRGVHVVGRGDVDRVGVLLLVQQLPPVLVDADVGEELADLGGAGEVHVGDGDEPEVAAGRERADVGQGHAVRAEAGVQ